MLPAQNFEQELIFKAMEGDLESFNQLVLNHQDIAHAHARNLLSDPDWAADVVQESFLKVFQKINSFRGGSFRAWVLKIVTNTAFDLYRQAVRHPAIPLQPVNDKDEEIESPVWLADPSASVEEAIEQNEEHVRLYRMLDELSVKFRSVITLIDIHEFDYAEAAEALGVPLGTVKSRLARARLQMREKLRDSHPTLPENFSSITGTFNAIHRQS